MSDDRDHDTGRRPGLSGALRTLAEENQSPPPVAGAEVRRLAVRRGRRRRTTVVACGVAAAAALAVTVTVGLGPGHDSGSGHDSGRRTAPAASPRLRTSPAPTATPAVAADAVVDLTGMTMTVDGRIMPISSGVPELPTPTGRFTVFAKSLKRPMETGGGSGTSVPSVPWVIELRSVDRKTTTAIALTYDLKAPGTYASTGGWIGLPEDDAKWVYTRLDKGAVVLVTGRTPSLRPSVSTPS
ncbi:MULTISPECIES: L,D-transpeptidase [unclassified Streptomyces]|uniref:L,D-transpeptidase n=1 Tax=unclassified Streptomyces TaxID=2593676 RepID=UPI0030089CC0